MPHIIYIVFLFALGSCIGSFLNVVVWRLPRLEAVENETMLGGFYRVLQTLSDPPSHCPKCKKLLKWYDNIPVLGWIKLGGKCRFCKSSFSIRYPVVEAITGLMFAGYYVAFFIYQIGPCSRLDWLSMGLGVNVYHKPHLTIARHAWLYGLDMALLSGLLAASLIDAEFFIIPLEIPWLIVPAAVVVHALCDQRGGPGNTADGPLAAAVSAGAFLGSVISFVLLMFKVLPRSFEQGLPLMEHERHETEKPQPKSGKARDGNKHDSPEVAEDERIGSPREIRREMRKEMAFLLLPLALGLLGLLLVWRVDWLGRWWNAFIIARPWLDTLLGSILGGMVGAFTVWITRILGSYAFGREAMGMGDVDLMAAVGAVLGAGPAVVAFFLAPFFGIVLAVYMLFTGKKRELPYGPYLSLATAFVMLFYCPIAAYYGPGLYRIAWLITQSIGGGGA